MFLFASLHFSSYDLSRINFPGINMLTEFEKFIATLNQMTLKGIVTLTLLVALVALIQL